MHCPKISNDMQHRKQLNIYELLQDESFHAWAKGAGNKLSRKWEKYFLDFPDQLHEAEEARRLILSVQFHKMELPDELIGSERVRLIERISQDEKIEKSVSTLTDAWKRNRIFFLTFPFILAMFILGAYFISRKFLTPPPVVWQQAVVPFGSRSMLVLPDSSHVWINAGSTLKYPDRFEETKEVYLTGEAYFETKATPSNPLVIHAGKLDIRSDGASFDLNAYPDDSLVETTLLSGNLLLRYAHPSNPVIRILSDQKAIYRTDENSIRIVPVKAVDYAGWSKGVLHFTGESMGQVIRQVERWFAIKVMAPPPVLGQDKYYGNFKAKAPEYVMNKLLESTPFRYYRENDTLFLKKRAGHRAVIDK